MRRLIFILGSLFAVVPVTTRAAQSAQTYPASTPTRQAKRTDRSVFTIKYVLEGSVYLDGGQNAGLEQGMVLHIVHAGPEGGPQEAVRFQTGDPIGDLRIFAVADSSAAAEILQAREDFAVGDLAYLDAQSVRLREDKENQIESDNYPIVVSFTYGDPLDEQIRADTVAAVKVKEAVPIESKIRGRIGFDFGSYTQPGGPGSKQIGLVLESNMDRINGSHWNFTGYWRGRLNIQSSKDFATNAPLTLTDLLNRTYHLGLTYSNSDSLVTVGVGRLLLPYAASLSTIDGGYLGWRVSTNVTIGGFAGSTPDPTSWSYAPNERMAGSFVNYESGDFDHLHMSDTFGLAVTTTQWHVAREFAFFDNTISLGRVFSVYSSVQFDKRRTTPAGVSYGTGITQSFMSMRYQPIKLISFNLNHNYLRNLPTFDQRLISLGLLDQYLFQGFSGGIRLDLPYRIAFTTDTGRSKSSADSTASLNQAYDALFGEIWKTGLQLDVRYSKFHSSFGQGRYEYASLSRNITEALRIQIQSGTQHLISALSADSNSRFVAGMADWSIGSRYFVEGQYSWNTDTSLNYRQLNMTIGYRFGKSILK